MPALITKTGDMWEPTAEQINKWVSLYPQVDVNGELLAMVGWLDANPGKRKTDRGMARFCNAWLKRAQDRGGEGMAKPKRQAMATRDMSDLDMLTHDFADSEAFRQSCLERHGQYFNGERVT